MSRGNACPRMPIKPERVRIPVVEPPHGPVVSLRAAVLTLRGGRVGPIEQAHVGVGGHRRELLRGRPGVHQEHVAPPEDGLIATINAE